MTIIFIYLRLHDLACIYIYIVYHSPPSVQDTTKVFQYEYDLMADLLFFQNNDTYKFICTHL